MIRRRSPPFVASLLAIAGCASAPPPAPVVPAPPCPAVAKEAPPAPVAAPAPTPTLGMYLPPERAFGSPYCLDPSSEALRRAVVHPRWEESDPLPAPQLADDVHDLHAAMKRLYAGYGELAQNPRFDVDRFFDEWEKTVRAAGATITFGDGVLKPFTALRAAHQDNHLAPWGYGVRFAKRPELAISEYQAKGRVASLDPVACTFGVTPMPGTLRAALEMSKSGVEDVTTFSARSIVDTIDVTCAGITTRFAKRPAPTLAVDENAPVYEWHTTKDATVIVVRRLYGSPKEEALLGQIAKDYDQHRKKPVVVFDFRNNGGGNDGYVNAWTDRAAARGPLPSPYIAVYDVGAQSPCGDWNDMVTDQITYKRIDDPDAKRERDEYWKKATPSPQDPVQRMVGLTADVSHAKAPYTGRVFALVNRRSGSSGESAPDQLRVGVGATLLGERTGGFAEFGDIRPWLMPRTGIGWQLASKRNYYESPRDGVGQPVEVYLAPDLIDAPVDELVPWLEKLPRGKR